MVDVGASKGYYYGNDQLGTPEILTDSTNTVVWEAIYKPFGEAEVNEHSTVVNNFRFPGQYYDQETGLHYNYYRYYDPSTGRYLTADPIGLKGGINLFAYVENNPTNKTDTLGRDYATGSYHKLRQGTEDKNYNCMAYGLGSSIWQPQDQDDPGNRNPNLIPPRFNCKKVDCNSECNCESEHKVAIYEDQSDWTKWHVYRQDRGGWSCKYGQAAIGDVSDPTADYKDVYNPGGKVIQTCWCCPN